MSLQIWTNRIQHAYESFSEAFRGKANATLHAWEKNVALQGEIPSRGQQSV